ncbi:Uncharacterised protein [Enterobacter cancerogenus]|uniref:Uncharacterized protein n=1 Tax=Enterobacter cancerogenus TaxID=69218 RepID=A0A484ZAI3_9ENTR|nr:Uncharacterised protein [Enterobacter cancerogenus]
MLRNVLSGAMYKMHVVAHTFLVCRLPGTRHHFSREIAQGDVMTPLCHQDGSLAFATARIKHTQSLARIVGKKLVEILPEDRLTQLAFSRAINVARKLFRDVIKIAIPHWESSTR